MKQVSIGKSLLIAAAIAAGTVLPCVAAEAIKREILRLYVQDIGKYAKGYAPKVRAIFRYLPFYMAHCL